MDEYPLKNDFLFWLKNIKNLKSYQNYASDIKEIDKNVDQIVQDYLYYVPALLSDNRILAQQLLACVYADICLYRPSILSYFKKYCEFLVSNLNTIIETEGQLNNSERENIINYLEKRQVWILDDKTAKHLKTIAGNKKSTFNELFNIRINSWGRPNFPLKIIKNVLKGETVTVKSGKNELTMSFMTYWVRGILNSIKVITGTDKSILLKNVKAFDLQREDKEEKFRVKAITDNKENPVIWTPLARGGFCEMEVDGLEYISIDHEYPLDAIVRSIVRKGDTELGKISDTYKNDPKFESTSLECLIKSVDKEALKTEMEKISTITDYYLMDRNENSSKSNNTDFQWFEEVDGEIWFIVAEDVEDADGEKYMVYFTKSDKSKKLKKKSELACILRTK